MRIGINVPERVRNQIKKLDPDVNVSKMCCQALEDYCAVLERATERVASDGTDEQVVRLSEGRLDEPDWAGYALDDVRDWVNQIDPETWDEFFELYESLKSKGEDVTWLPGSYCWMEGMEDKHFFAHSAKHSEWFFQQAKRNRDPRALTKARDEYTRAWLGYVTEVRRKQLQYVAERDERERAERERAWKARPEPEVPPQLR